MIFGCSAATTEAFTEAALDPDEREAEVEPNRDAEDVEDVREVIISEILGPTLATTPATTFCSVVGDVSVETV